MKYHCNKNNPQIALIKNPFPTKIYLFLDLWNPVLFPILLTGFASVKTQVVENIILSTIGNIKL